MKVGVKERGEREKKKENTDKNEGRERKSEVKRMMLPLQSLSGCEGK